MGIAGGSLKYWYAASQPRQRAKKTSPQRVGWVAWLLRVAVRLLSLHQVLRLLAETGDAEPHPVAGLQVLGRFQP